MAIAIAKCGLIPLLIAALGAMPQGDTQCYTCTKAHVDKEGSGVNVVSSDDVDGIRVRLFPGDHPRVINLNWRLANGDAATSVVYCQGASSQVAPAAVVSRAGETVRFIAATAIAKVTSTIPVVPHVQDNVATIDIASDCPSGAGEVVFELSGGTQVQKARIWIDGQLPRAVKEDNPEALGAAIWADVSKCLQALCLERVSLEVRQRRTIVHGGLSSNDLLEETRLACLSDGATEAGLWWEKWRVDLERLQASGVNSDESVAVVSQKGVTKYEYLSYLPQANLTARPLAALYTNQNYLSLVYDKRTGLEVHLLPRTSVLLIDHSSLTSPLPCAEHQIEAMAAWSIRATKRGGIAELECANPVQADNRYVLFYKGASSLPSGAYLRSGDADIAAVFEWRFSDGAAWLGKVCKVRRSNNKAVIELAEVGKFRLALADSDAVLHSGRPVSYIDERFGQYSEMAFDMQALPEEVRQYFRVREGK